LHFARLTASHEPRRCIVTVVSRRDGTVDLNINGGESVKLLAEAGDSEVDVAVPASAASGPRSYEAPDARAACSPAMARRRNRIADRVKASTRAGRRRKTYAEELQELIDVSAALDADLYSASLGSKASVGAVATHLRA
jgi:hypothetical protein